jgi:hypothetical protein
MATVYKVLGQVEPSSNTLTTLYTVPAATQAVCSTLAITNLGITSQYRVAIRPAGASIEDKHYIIYNSTISQYDSVFLTIGATLGNTDVVSVYSSNTSNIAYTLFGSEIS